MKNAKIRLGSAAILFGLSMACSSAPADSNGDNAVTPADDTSEDELNTKARFTHLKSGPTDTNLKYLFSAANKLGSSYVGVYRYNKATTEATDQDAREKRIKEVMHRYMCSFFDDSIDIARSTGTVTKKISSTVSDLDLDNEASDASKTDLAAFSTALTYVFGNAKLDVLSGGASGNNTAGEVMGVYDEAHNEIFFFGFTNCGSDD